MHLQLNNFILFAWCRLLVGEKFAFIDPLCLLLRDQVIIYCTARRVWLNLLTLLILDLSSWKVKKPENKTGMRIVETRCDKWLWSLGWSTAAVFDWPALAQQLWASQRELPDRSVTVCARLRVGKNLPLLPLIVSKESVTFPGCLRCSSYCQRGEKKMLTVGMVMTSMNNHLLPGASFCVPHSLLFFSGLF